MKEQIIVFDNQFVAGKEEEKRMRGSHKTPGHGNPAVQTTGIPLAPFGGLGTGTPFDSGDEGVGGIEPGA